MNMVAAEKRNLINEHALNREPVPLSGSVENMASHLLTKSIT